MPNRKQNLLLEVKEQIVYLKLFITSLVPAKSQIMGQLQRTRKIHCGSEINSLQGVTSSIRSYCIPTTANLKTQNRILIKRNTYPKSQN